MIDNPTIKTPATLHPWGNERPYNAYKDFLKGRFGGRLQKVSVNAGFTCPNRDGVKAFGGCTYCNNDSFVPPYCKPGMSIREQVDAGIEYLSRRYKVHQFLVYFQAYSNTYAPLDYLRSVYSQALAHPQVHGLAIGTRPDCVDEEKIDYISSLAKDKFISIEYGLESMFDESLDRLNRAGTFQEWVDAINLSANRGIHLCTHVILGLPGETREMMLETAEMLSTMPINSLKLHHLHVVKKTILASEYQKEPFPLLGYSEYIDLVVEFLERLRGDIYLERLVGETHPRMLLGPHWGVRAAQVQQHIEAEMRRRGTWQGRLVKSNV